MNNVKKFAAIGGAIAVIACWPLAVGQFAQSTITNAIQDINAKDFNVTLVEYDRGYLGATATTEISIVDPVMKRAFEKDSLPTTILVNHDIHHGLFSVSSESKLEDYAKFPVMVNTTTSLMGSTKLDIKAEAMSFDLDDETTLEFSTGSANGNISSNGEMDISYQLDKFSGHFSNGESIILDGLSGHSQGNKVNGFWLGEQGLNLSKAVAVSTSGENMMELTNAAYQFDTTEDKANKTFSSKHQISIENAMIEQEDLSDLGIEFSFSKVDMDSFTQLLNVYQTQGQALKGQTLSDTDIQSIIDNINTLLAKGLDVSLDKVKANIRTGHLDGNWVLSLPAGQEQLTANPMKLLTSLTGQTNLFVSKEMVTEFPFIADGLEGLVKEGIMEAKEDGYHLKGDIKEGNVNFSAGKTFPAIVLFAPLLMQ